MVVLAGKRSLIGGTTHWFRVGFLTCDPPVFRGRGELRWYSQSSELLARIFSFSLCCSSSFFFSVLYIREIFNVITFSCFYYAIISLTIENARKCVMCYLFYYIIICLIIKNASKNHREIVELFKNYCLDWSFEQQEICILKNWSPYIFWSLECVSKLYRDTFIIKLSYLLLQNLLL